MDLLLRVSALACALPWVRALLLDPIVVARNRLEIPSARIVVDPKRKPAPGYRHMAIHPYPVELESQIVLADGTKLVMRPIRPEDAELERRFVASLSDQTRYYRFFYQLHELSPAMLARFTQVDYDRELALLALAPDAEGPGGVAIVGIARYIANVRPRERGIRGGRRRCLARPRRRDATHEGAHRVREKKRSAAPRRYRVACQSEHAAIFTAAWIHDSR